MSARSVRNTIEISRSTAPSAVDVPSPAIPSSSRPYMPEDTIIPISTNRPLCKSNFTLRLLDCWTGRVLKIIQQMTDIAGAAMLTSWPGVLQPPGPSLITITIIIIIIAIDIIIIPVITMIFATINHHVRIKKAVTRTHTGRQTRRSLVG